MSQGFSFDVFLSYNTRDKPRVLRLAERLRAAGLEVWLDAWRVLAGDAILLKVEEGLDRSRVLVLCMSPWSLDSNWVTHEQAAVRFRDPANSARRFVPLMLTDCAPPNSLLQYKYVDYRDETDAAFDELLQAIRPGETRALNDSGTSTAATTAHPQASERIRVTLTMDIEWSSRPEVEKAVGALTTELARVISRFSVADIRQGSVKVVLEFHDAAESQKLTQYLKHANEILLSVFHRHRVVEVNGEPVPRSHVQQPPPRLGAPSMLALRAWRRERRRSSGTRVFLSYHHDDRSIAEEFVRELENQGASVWWNQSLTGGEDFAHTIARELDHADVAVVLWSSRSVQSRWVRDEAERGKSKLFPLIVERGISVPLGFGTDHAPNYFEDERTRDRLRSLCVAIVGATDRRTARVEPQTRPLSHADARARPFLLGSRFIPALLVAATLPVVGYTAYRAWPETDPPCAIECLETSAQAGRLHPTYLAVGRQIVADGRLTLGKTTPHDPVRRAVIDANFLLAVRACSKSCASPEIRISEAWMTVHVQQKRQQNAAVDAAGVTLDVQGDKCVTDATGRCDLRIRNVPMFSQVRVRAVRGGHEVTLERSASELIGREVTLAMEMPAHSIEVEIVRCGTNEPLERASVGLSAANSDAWSDACGSLRPKNLNECREAVLVNGSARFYVDATARQLVFAVKPLGAAKPSEYSVDAGPRSFTLKYPARCSVPPAPPDAGKRTCVRGFWNPLMGDKRNYGPDDRVRVDRLCAGPPPNAEDTWAFEADGLSGHCRCARWE